MIIYVCLGKSRHLRLQETENIECFSVSFAYCILFSKFFVCSEGLSRYKMEKVTKKSKYVEVPKVFLFCNHLWSLSVISLILEFAHPLMYYYETFMDQQSFLQAIAFIVNLIAVASVIKKFTLQETVEQFWGSVGLSKLILTLQGVCWLMGNKWRWISRGERGAQYCPSLGITHLSYMSFPCLQYSSEYHPCLAVTAFHPHLWL